MENQEPEFLVEGVVFKDIISYPRLALPHGSMTFISGDSGCGKTTLLKLLNGVVSPQKGKIFYQGRELAQWDSLLLRRQVLLVGQQVYLFEETIAENFASFYGYRGLEAPSSEEMERSLALCCADFPPDKSCLAMSGGERHRIFLAIYSSFAPRVLLLDEPTAALDGATAERFLTNLRQSMIERDQTVVVVSHDRELAQRFADHRIELGSGAQEVS